MSLFVLCSFLLLNYFEISNAESFQNECHTSDKFVDKIKPLIKAMVPSLEGKSKGDSGRIAVIGGSVEYTGAPYFAAQTALKVGADVTYVVTTEAAAPIIKSYSPDLIVYPIFSINTASKIDNLIQRMDVVVLGPGLGRDNDTLRLIYDIISACKSLKKPLVIDADGLYAVAKDLSVIENYPSPGVILTPNHREANRLMEAISKKAFNGYNYWGDNVSVLVKGAQDQLYSSTSKYNWSLSEGGSNRRCGGQGDILAGALGTLLNWALTNNPCKVEQQTQLSHSIAAYAAAKFTRTCNFKAFEIHGRSMVASDMLREINAAFKETFS